MPHHISEVASAIAALASLGQAEPAEVMRLRAPAAAPAGYVAFCRRAPTQCGDDVIEVLRAASEAEAPHQTSGDVLTPASSAASGALKAASARPPTEARALTPSRWRQLVTVNVQVNRSLRPHADVLAWGVEDYWTLPLQAGASVGDCEDYVLEKRRALLKAGFPAGSLNIAIVTTQTGEVHAVLLVATREGELVLDNLSPWVRPWNATGYTWRIRQVNGQPFTWMEVG